MTDLEVDWRKHFYIYLEGNFLSAWLPEPHSGWQTLIFGRTIEDAERIREIYEEGNKNQKVRIKYVNKKGISAIGRISIDELTKITGIDYRSSRFGDIHFHNSIDKMFEKITEN